MRRHLQLALVLTVSLFAAAPLVHAQPAWDVAAQYGFDATAHEEYFHYYGLSVGMEYERYWQWGNGWSLDPGFSVNPGVLHAGGEDGFIVTAGPRLELNFPGDWLTLSGSVRAGALSEDEYGRMDIGGWFTFAEDIGIRVNLGRSLSAGYLFQHISNAEIYADNPGVDLHMLEIRYRF
ncbi:MAG: acyloxyacyl hydrolase [Desulfobacterales bacterium]